ITNYLGKIIQVVEAPDDLNYNTYYTYNAAGEVVNIRDNENKNIVFKFDSLDRKYEMIDPDLGTIQYSYNKNNTLHTQTDAKNNIIEFEYDDLKRVTKKKYLSTSDKDVVYTYDLGTNGIGNLYSISNSDVTSVFNEYDKLGNCLQETKTIGSKTYVTKYAFDITGKPSEIIYPNNYRLIYQYYTGTNLLKLVQGDSGVHVEYSSYEPTGKIGQLVFGNEAKTSYTYNPYTTRLETFLTTVPEGSSVKNLQNKRYEYTAAGDIKTIIDNVAGSMSTYTYDQLHRLLSESTYGGKPSILKNSVLTFEHTGETGIPHHAPKSISLNNQPFVTMTYDKNGNMTQSFDFTSLTGFHNRSIAYNGDNMPLSINHGSNGTTTFLYDGTAKRARKSHNGKDTYYISKYSEEINNQVTNYIFGGNLRIAKIKGTETFYFHKDHLGSTTVLTDNAVNPGDDVKVIETAQYAPYGMEKSTSENTEELNYKFTDQEKDKSTGLYNYDARLYDPVIGIFVSADTVIPNLYDPQSLNRYAYCRNNPLMYVDPSGHVKVDKDDKDKVEKDNKDKVEKDDKDKVEKDDKYKVEKDVQGTFFSGFGYRLNGILAGVEASGILVVGSSEIENYTKQKAEFYLSSHPAFGASFGRGIFGGYWSGNYETFDTAKEWGVDTPIGCISVLYDKKDLGFSIGGFAPGLSLFHKGNDSIFAGKKFRKYEHTTNLNDYRYDPKSNDLHDIDFGF
ncbi:MAG: RHS repeat-associated core domain-containing protein, partial [Desulfobacterales bacterium]|nr:RHS repeat-associated core domain-containing protein [Desulfobacterales bacterium]